MTRWTLAEVTTALGQPLTVGELSCSSEFTEVSTDTRSLTQGALYVPLVGERFDGHDFLQAAASKGARASLWGRSELPFSGESWSLPLWKVDDTLEAYQCLARHWKNLCGAEAVGVTGSVGKTTTKELLTQLLRPFYQVSASEKNFNNDVGVPLTLLGLSPLDQIAVLEMGMRGRGEIARLARCAQPRVGLITGIGSSHLELLGSREEIARAKGELVEELPSDGWAVLPYNDDFYALLCELSHAPVIAYSANPGVLNQGPSLPEGGLLCPQEIISEDPRGTAFRFSEKDYYLPLPGRHHLHDLFAALATALALGLEPTEVLSGIGNLQPPEGRAEWLTLGGVQVYLDAYNSAPESLHASLGVLAQCQARRLAVLGDMLELGETATEAHRRAGRNLRDFGIHKVWCFGPLSKGMAEEARSTGVHAEWFEDKSALTAALAKELQSGDCLLIKASRGMALETVVDTLKSELTAI